MVNRCEHMYLPIAITVDGTICGFEDGNDVEETNKGFIILKCAECDTISFQSIVHNNELV